MALPPHRFVYLVGSYAIVYGLLTCVIAFRMHSLPQRIAGILVPPGATPTFWEVVQIQRESSCGTGG
jgi:hypothetical protein